MTIVRFDIGLCQVPIRANVLLVYAFIGGHRA